MNSKLEKKSQSIVKEKESGLKNKVSAKNPKLKKERPSSGKTVSSPAPSKGAKSKKKAREEESEAAEDPEVADRKLLAKMKQESIERMKGFVESINNVLKKETLEEYYVKNLGNILADIQPDPMFLENESKNRSSSIFCNELTRVKLKPPIDGNNYIHANHVRIENALNTYIVTQHPLTNTLADFWKMILSEGVRFIISLTNLSSYPDYYPKNPNETMTFNDITISCRVNKKITNKYRGNIYIVSIEKPRRKGASTIKIYHYPFWGKTSVPEHPEVVRRILRNTILPRRYHTPILIQCETGVDQSSVVVFAEAILSCLERNNPADIVSIFTDMRNQRSMMMSNPSHFAYSIYTVLYSIREHLKKEVGVADMIQTINEIEAQLLPNFKNLFGLEPEELSNASPTEDNAEALLLKKKAKNRSKNK